MSRSVVPIAWWPISVVSGIESVGLLEDPIASVGMIGWFVGVAMNLVGPVQYLVQIGWSVYVCLEWLLPLTGLRIVKSSVHRCVAYVTATVVFGSSWLAVAISDFGSA